MNAKEGIIIKRYQLDRVAPRQLTPAEARSLDEAPIDYSDIPPLGDDFFAKAAAPWPPPGYLRNNN